MVGGVGDAPAGVMYGVSSPRGRGGYQQRGGRGGHYQQPYPQYQQQQQQQQQYQQAAPYQYREQAVPQPAAAARTDRMVLFDSGAPTAAGGPGAAGKPRRREDPALPSGIKIVIRNDGK